MLELILPAGVKSRWIWNRGILLTAVVLDST